MVGNNCVGPPWYALDANGTLGFTWSASDDDLTHASLANVPGPGSPSDDGREHWHMDGTGTRVLSQKELTILG